MDISGRRIGFVSLSMEVTALIVSLSLRFLSAAGIVRYLCLAKIRSGRKMGLLYELSVQVRDGFQLERA